MTVLEEIDAKLTKLKEYCYYLADVRTHFNKETLLTFEEYYSMPTWGRRSGRTMKMVREVCKHIINTDKEVHIEAVCAEHFQDIKESINYYLSHTRNGNLISKSYKAKRLDRNRLYHQQEDKIFVDHYTIESWQFKNSKKSGKIIMG